MMIPVCLVAGFPGSGKTTFLRKFFNANAEGKYLYLLHEIDDTRIDGEVLKIEGYNTKLIQGGSILFHGNTDELIKMLSCIKNNRPDEFRAVIVETDGLSDPSFFYDLISSKGLDDLYSIYSILTIVDPGNLEKMLKSIPTLKRQIMVSGAVIVNKSDIYPMHILDRAVSQIQSLNNEAAVIVTHHADSMMNIFEVGVSAELDFKIANCPFSDAETFTFHPKHRISEESWKRFFAENSQQLYRVKGFVECEGMGSCLLDYSGSGLMIKPFRGFRGPQKLSVIFPKGNGAVIWRKMREL